MYIIVILIISVLYLFHDARTFLFVQYLSPLLKKITAYIRNYLISIIQDEEIINTIKIQLNILLTDKQLNEKLIEIIKEDVKRISIDSEINAYIHEVIQTQLESSDSSDRTRAAIAKILKTQVETITSEEWFIQEIKNQITTIVTNTCDSSEVKDKLRELLEKLSGDLVNSGKINNKLNELVSQIINDEHFIKNIGSGIRRSVKQSVYGVFWPESRPDHIDNTDYEKEKPFVEKVKVSIISKHKEN